MATNYKNSLAFSNQNRFTIFLGIGIMLFLAGILITTGINSHEDCSNGIDDDGDGLVDCDDPDCATYFDCLMGENADLYETGVWSLNSANTYSSNASSIQVSVSGTAIGSGLFSASPNGIYSNNNFWVKDIANHASFEVLFEWDTLPELSISDIDDVGDDKGSGTITFSFSEEVTNPVLHIDRIGGSGFVYNDPYNTDTLASTAVLTLLTPGISIVEVAGTEDFETSGTSIRRTPDVPTTFTINAFNELNLGTAAGSVVLVGTFSEVSFAWSAEGVEGTGADEMEFVWTINNLSSFPVEWLGVAAEWEEANGLISWQTATEQNTFYYEVERKVGGQGAYEILGEVQASGYSNTVQSYSYTDRDAAWKTGNEVLYYRIRQIDLDGKFEYSNIVELQPKDADIGIKLYPNPASDFVNIDITKEDHSSPTSLIVFNTSGQQIMTKNLAPGVVSWKWAVNEWASGTYLVKIISRNQTQTSQLIVR